MKPCQACNIANDADSVFCTSCGARLGTAEPVSAPGSNQKTVAIKPFWKIILGGCAAVVFVVGLTHYVVDVARRSAVQEVEQSIPKVTETIPKIFESIPKITDIIPKSKKEVAKVVTSTVGDDQAVGQLKGKPKKFSSILKEVESSKNYQYKKENCTALFTDTLQQGAYAVQGELADITQLSVKEENRIGQNIAKQIRRKFRGKLDQDVQWLKYVKKIGRQLVSRVNRPGIDYQFHVIRNPAINAFAIPGGGIYVYTGILEKMKNEAQLAAVLAHEIKHVDLRHCIFVVQMIKQLPEAVQNPNWVAAGKMITNPYSGRQEADADRRGVDLIYSFGYSPHQIVAFWQGMSASAKNGGSKPKRQSPLSNILGNVFEEVDNVLRSHPSAAKRACLLKNYIIDLNGQHPVKRIYVGKWNYQNKTPMFERSV